MKPSKHKSESEMNQASPNLLIEYYLKEMTRRNCTPDTIVANQRALQRFLAFLAESHSPLIS